MKNTTAIEFTERKPCQETHMKPGRSKSRRSLLFSIMFYVLYIAASVIDPVDAKVSWNLGSRHSFEVVARDVGDASHVLPSTSAALGGVTGHRRTRPRRSAKERDFVQFRQFLHKLRNARRGARVRLPFDLRRDAAATLTERSSTANEIAKKVECGGCKLTKQWIPVSKKGCRTNYVLAPTCMGMCETWEIPDVNPPYVTTHHRVCRPTKLEFWKIRLQRCNPGVNAYHVIPVAMNCSCLKCKSRNTACRPL